MKTLFVLLLVLTLLFGPGAVSSNLVEASSAPADEVLITLGDPITVNGPGAVVAGNTVTIVAGGVFRAIGTLADGMIEVNTTDEVTLILDDIALTNSSGPAIKVSDAMLVSLILADGTTNTLVDGSSYSGAKGTLFSNDPLEISGHGALQITGNYKHGIVSDDNIVIDSGDITIQSATDGMHANDDITVHGGTITITESNDGIESEGTLLIDGGVLTVAADDDGIVSEGAMVVNGGAIEITTAVDGLDSKDTLTIDQGEVSVEASDNGLSAANDLTVNGGQIYAHAADDVIKSDGTMSFNGGVTVAVGGESPISSLVCGESCEIAFNGGIVVATGGAYSTLSGSSAQRVAVLGPGEAGTALRIVRDDGEDVLTFEASQAYENMIFSSPALLANRVFNVRKGGSISGGSDFHGLYTSATYTGGSLVAFFNTDAVVTYVGRIYRYLPICPISAS
ncbi:MAG: carbohydrate-binding domain-containing protein [Caldilineae bacterium]|nr:carbohydrate-binding domain-containing protein [Caldilineae bacterium]